jgi:hypothetical protein
MIKVDKGFAWPELLLQLLAYHHFACTFEQYAKDKKGLALQAESLSVPGQLS